MDVYDIELNIWLFFLFFLAPFCLLSVLLSCIAAEKRAAVRGLLLALVSAGLAFVILNLGNHAAAAIAAVAATPAIIFYDLAGVWRAYKGRRKKRALIAFAILCICAAFVLLAGRGTFISLWHHYH